MRCPDCNKFVAYDDSSDPEVELEVAAEPGDGETPSISIKVSAQVRIVLTCAECSTELKSAEFEPDQEFLLADDTAKEHMQLMLDGEPAEEGVDGASWEMKDGCDFVVDDNGSEQTSRTVGKGRGMKTFYGFTTAFSVRCECGKGGTLHEDHLSDDVQASSMDECV